MSYKQLASDIIENIGGKSNVKLVVHCATRLRFTLNDPSKANTDKISNLNGVLKVVDGGGQYQIVIGPDVPQVYQEVIALAGLEAGDSNIGLESEEDKRSKLSKVLEGIASIFQPIIPAITGAGLLKAVMALCSIFGWLKSGSQTYIILNAIADAAFYFLPLILAASCAKKFKCNQGTAMALGGVLVYPQLTTLMTSVTSVNKAVTAAGSYEAALAAGTIVEGAATSIKLFNIIPVQVVTSYASSVIPIILGVWVMSYVEKFMQKYCPKAVKFFFVPFFSLTIGAILTLSLLGPIGTWASELIQVFFTWLKNTAPWIVPTVVGIFSPFLVMTGTHYGLIPIGTNNLTTVGHDAAVGPGMLVSNTAQGAAGLAVALRSKNPDTKQLASSTGLTGVLGITEPVLYGVNLKFMFPLYAAMIGGGVGGLFLGLTGVERFDAGSPGLLVLPVYIPTEQALALGFTMNNFIFAVIGVAIAMLVSFVSCWIMFGIWAKQGKLDPKELGEIKEIDNNIYAPVEGETVELSKVEDEVFSSLAMGNGIAINPSKGEVTVLFPTGHAIGIKGDNGAEVLIHVGMDTVTLNGEGFDVKVKQGDRVKKGQVLVNFDIDFIKSKNLSTITPVVVTNTSSLKEVKPHDAGKVTNEDVIINIK
ncbi:MAG: beta-glucoside-specific PTS transporter subunit IIABC [Solobacterium sp.]|nr:beta-glucoside-specific PTS transporter subunit IIABC [Solobacterium sp.]MDY5402318.1 beta-glucoside-specific PTS transporter subunit IIABC [Erysipelotrichaceae bacterium]